MKKKIKSQPQDEYIFKFIRLTASKYNTCVIGNKNYVFKMAKDKTILFHVFSWTKVKSRSIEKGKKELVYLQFSAILTEQADQVHLPCEQRLHFYCLHWQV